jgi:GntR family transcriptional repressor for pyruvate dehydrogenase complex
MASLGDEVNKHKPIERVQRLKVADSVAEQLERLILDGNYEVGEKLPAERALAEEFGVGRSSMREAIRTVESYGLLRTDHGIGVFVVSNRKQLLVPSDLILSGEYTINHLFQVRAALEGAAAAAATENITQDQSDQLLRIFEQSAGDISDEAFVELDGDLHGAISRASGNPLFVHLSETIEPLFVMYSQRVIRLPGRREAALAGHRRIIQAVISGSPQEAQSAAVAHITEVQKDIVDHLEGP